MNLSIVIRPSTTSDPKMIAKHAGVRRYAASNTAEGAQILLLRVIDGIRSLTVNEVLTAVGIGHTE